MRKALLCPAQNIVTRFVMSQTSRSVFSILVARNGRNRGTLILGGRRARPDFQGTSGSAHWNMFRRNALKWSPTPALKRPQAGDWHFGADKAYHKRAR